VRFSIRSVLALVLVLSVLTAVIVGSFLVFDLVVTFPLDVSGGSVQRATSWLYNISRASMRNPPVAYWQGRWRAAGLRTAHITPVVRKFVAR
jgi:hypothetical protein